MPIIKIDCENICDWDSFHNEFSTALGFPEFYGRNMNAWIDCMSDLDDPNGGMSKTVVAEGQVLSLVLVNVKSFRVRVPEIYSALVDCAAFVNWRRLENSEAPILALAFNE